MKATRLIALILCLILSLNLFAPVANATESIENCLGNIITYEDLAIYNLEESSYRCIIFLNTTTATGSFSINYFNNPDYLYEYYFTVDSSGISVNSPSYWNSILGECISNESLWTEIYIPASIEMSSDNYNANQRSTTDAIENQLLEDIEEIIGSAPYTGRIMATSYKGSLIFHVHQDLKYFAELDTSITLREMISISSLISILQKDVTSFLIGILENLFGASGIIPSGSKVQTYSVYARWERYVKKKDSSIWLTSGYQRFISYDAYANGSTGFCEIDTGSRTEKYYPPKAQYEDLNAMLEEGYQAYIS